VLNRLDRYIAREIAVSLTAVQIVLLLIMVSNQVLRVLGDVTAGTLPADAVATVLTGFSIKTFLRLLPISFYLGVILGLGRLYRDSEIVVMRACGVTDWDLLRPVAAVGLPVMLLSAAATLYVIPWADRIAEAATEAAAAELGLGALRPGRFTVADDGRITLFVEDIARDGRSLEGVFVENRGGARRGVERAEGGKSILDTRSGDRFLVLGPGVRYEGESGQATMRIIEYREHGILLREREPVVNLDRIRVKATAELMQSNRRADRVELQWRFSLPFATVALGLLALPLSRVSPRQGRFGKFAVGLLAFIVFMNLLGLNRAWMEKGLVGAFPGFWWIYVLGVVVAVMLMALQNRWLERWRYRGGSSA
jgi:lipopolysaccharide export system permease protein